ncbi:MAG: hypothetical protein IE926_01840 [Micrococcales bacterium]|nr:hypothetical protein [Micrococcales bacterium]
MAKHNPIPESITTSDLAAALEVLGFDVARSRGGLISLHFDLVDRRLTVKRNVRNEAGVIAAGGAGVTLEVAIDFDPPSLVPAPCAAPLSSASA